MTRSPQLHLYTQTRHSATFTIGRRRQEYRQQAQEDKPRRKDKAEKGRPKNRNRGQVGRRKMGNEESTMVDPSTRPTTLSARNTEALAKYIQEGKARKIVVLVGRIPFCRGNSVLTLYRLELALVHQRAYQTSGHQRPGYTPISSA